MTRTATNVKAPLESSDYAAAISAEPLTADQLRKVHAYWRACNYLAGGMIYLCDNPLLRQALKVENVKKRLLGHWGTSPGLSFMYVHLNRLINKYDLNAIFLAGPGHGAPGVSGPAYLEGTYSEVYPNKGEDEAGMRQFFKEFSFPGGIGSHCTPETPGSIHEGGELGYSLSHAFGAAFDNPDLLVAVAVGDGEAETGPLATAWHSNKFLNPARDGAVLPILQLNGYKINNPTILRASRTRSYRPCLRGMAGRRISSREPIQWSCIKRWPRHWRNASGIFDGIQQQARGNRKAGRARWPMIVLRSPKGWTGPKEVDGHRVEGFWRDHQVPIAGVRENPEHLKILDQWLRSYKPQELFDESGRLVAELKDLAPRDARRMSANPHANGGPAAQAATHA